MLRFGNISSVDADRGLARVRFEEDGIVTALLPMIGSRTSRDKFYAMPDVGEHVACLMDEYAENGVILGAIYSTKNTPGEVKGQDKIGVEFASGDLIEQDRQERYLRVKMGDTEVKISQGGPSLTKSNESLKTILVDLLSAIMAETHPTGVGPSGPPINLPQYQAIQTRINQFFES
jgi:phage baseplate assembly protein V